MAIFAEVEEKYLIDGVDCWNDRGKFVRARSRGVVDLRSGVKAILRWWGSEGTTNYLNAKKLQPDSSQVMP